MLGSRSVRLEQAAQCAIGDFAPRAEPDATGECWVSRKGEAGVTVVLHRALRLENAHSGWKDSEPAAISKKRSGGRILRTERAHNVRYEKWRCRVRPREGVTEAALQCRDLR